MPNLDEFAITHKWPAQHPDRLQLYSLPTPNGVKVSIMLEETGLPYEAHRVSFETNDQLSPEFIATFPNNKIPAILDPNGPGAGPWPCLNRALVRSIRRALAAFVARPAVALGLVVPQ